MCRAAGENFWNVRFRIHGHGRRSEDVFKDYLYRCNLVCNYIATWSRREIEIRQLWTNKQLAMYRGGGRGVVPLTISILEYLSIEISGAA